MRAAARGDVVVALDVDAAGLANLASVVTSEAPVAMIVAVCCDVSNATDVARAVETVRTKLGGRTIDVVANFAGLIRGGPLLELDDSELERVMAVNVLGTHRVTKAFIPLMHTEEPRDVESRIPSPKIIVVASELSYANFSAGFSAPYSMSKFALEAYAFSAQNRYKTDAFIDDDHFYVDGYLHMCVVRSRYASSLRLELSLLRNPIDVVVLNPGAMSTPMLFSQMAGGSNAFFEQYAAQGSVYGPFLRRGGVIAQEYMSRNKRDPQTVAAVVEEIVHAHRPAPRYVIGASFEMRYLIPYIPQCVLDAGTRMQLRRA